jgi:16S rRNA processing protein RimM
MPLSQDNKDSNKEFVIVGNFGRAQGLKGLVRVNSFTEPKDNITDYTPWFIKTNDGMSQLNIIDIERHNDSIFVKIEDYACRDKVSKLTNKEIFVYKTTLPALSDKEYYWHDLIGLSVFNQENVELGVVAEILATGSNDVLIVEGEKRLLIPYLLDICIKQIDLTNKTIIVDWDEDF